jgi:hypothetical protein
MTKDGPTPDGESAENLAKEAEAARVREHVRAVLSRLKSRVRKPSREAE